MGLDSVRYPSDVFHYVSFGAVTHLLVTGVDVNITKVKLTLIAYFSFYLDGLYTKI